MLPWEDGDEQCIPTMGCPAASCSSPLWLGTVRPKNQKNMGTEPIFAMAAKDKVGGQPLRLLYSGAGGKFELGADAIEALRAVKTPLAVAAVCGRARQGKRRALAGCHSR